MQIFIHCKTTSFAVNKYLHTVAFVGFLFTMNYDARNHELKKKYFPSNWALTSVTKHVSRVEIAIWFATPRIPAFRKNELPSPLLPDGC